MADENVHKKEIHIRDVATRSVTFYPRRAQVVRDIENVVLKDPTKSPSSASHPPADENSIKVDGHGNATITDLSVELVRNPEIFEEIYRSDSEDASDKERKQLYGSKQQTLAEIEELSEEIVRCEKKVDVIKKKGLKEQRKEKQRKSKEQERQERIIREKLVAKQRLKNERINFWPKKVYKVIITLDTGPSTPASSRRGSLEDARKAEVTSK
ncbi:MAG: hypothetical protein LQ340_002088, partial [Diploschistes diacapsis]